MGVHYYVVNTAKRQFFEPGELLSSDRFTGMLNGLSGQALAVLIRDLPPNDHRQRQPGQDRPFVSPDGLWAGDPLYAVGDCAQDSIVHAVATEAIEPGQEAAEVLRTQYTDITPILVVYFFDDEEQRFLTRAEHNGSLFANLANLITLFDLRAMERTFVGHFGKDWRRRYDQVMQTWEGNRLWNLERLRTMLPPKQPG